ncbi:hypothetical protein CsatB_028926 [Cannabis sativa]
MLNEPSIREKEDIEMIDISPTWMTLMINYLLDGKLPTEKNEAQKLLYSVSRYTIVEGKLYRRGYSMPLLQCVLPTEANEIIREIPEGFCGDHAGWFGIPMKIVFNNETQFDGDLFTEFFERNKIIKSFSSVSKPQANGQVEVGNKTLKDTIKKKLDAAKGRWVDELPQVLWAHKTTEKTATGHTPFSLAFGSEAM